MKRSLFAELRRRNVIRMAGLYFVGAWLMTQVAGTVLPMFGAPDWLARSIVLLLVIGAVPTLIFSWVYELTPEGLKREADVDRTTSITSQTGRRIDRSMTILLVLALGYFAFDKFLLAPRREAEHLQQQAEQLRQPQDAAAKAGSADAQILSYGDKSIAVLPFVNMSDEKSNEFFSDGISEELLNLLAKIPQLQVTARTSSFAFKGEKIGIAEVARQLHVGHVLEGSVRKAGNTVRITAQLINAATDTHLWSETYDRKLDDIFAVQDEIAADVVKQLKVTLLGAAPKARATDPETYALYLQAKQLGRQFTAEAFKQSDALYHKALAIDPRYAPAWDGLTTNLLNEPNIGLLSNEEGLKQARAATDKALAIDPDYARAHASLGWIAMVQGDLSGAAQHFGRALALDPSDLDILRNCASLLQYLGRLNEAITVNEFVLARDPVDVTTLNNQAGSYLSAGRFDDAIANLSIGLSLSPDRGGTHALWGTALLLKGDAPASLAQMRQETSEVFRLIGLPTTYHALGQRAESDAALSQLIAKYEKDAPYNIAYVYASRGDADKAFEWLDKAVAYADPGLMDLPVQILFDKIRNDPRWLPFLRKIGKAPEQLAKIEFKVTLPQAGGSAASSGGANH